MKLVAGTLAIAFLLLTTIVCANAFLMSRAGATQQVASNGMGDMPMPAMPGMCNGAGGISFSCPAGMTGFEMLAHHSMMYATFTHALSESSFLFVALGLFFGLASLFWHTRWREIQALITASKIRTYSRLISRSASDTRLKLVLRHWLALLEASPTFA